MDAYVYTGNVCLSTPALAINAAGSATVKYGSTFNFKANGRVSPSVTSATAPSLALATLNAPFPNGSSTVNVAGVLATGYARAYTLVATLPINGTATSIPTFSWLAGTDFSATSDVVNTSSVALPAVNNQTAVGFVFVSNQSGSNFIPNTTNLDAAGIVTTYVNNFGINGL
jgi:hypothetical protein